MQFVFADQADGALSGSFFCLRRREHLPMRRRLQFSLESLLLAAGLTACAASLIVNYRRTLACFFRSAPSVVTTLPPPSAGGEGLDSLLQPLAIAACLFIPMCVLSAIRRFNICRENRNQPLHGERGT
jgi:hypothetical protein